MAGFKDCIAEIIQRFDSNWTTTAKVYDNTEYTPSTDTDFVFCGVEFASTSQDSMSNVGSRLFRANGVIRINIFTAINQGAGKGSGYADTISTIFRGVSTSTIRYKPPILSGQKKAKLESGNYWFTPVFIEFQYDARF